MSYQTKTVSDTDVEFDAQLRSLLGRCASADGAALQRLYELVSPMLFGCLTRILRRRSVAEEALQDVFVTICESVGELLATNEMPPTAEPGTVTLVPTA